MPDLKMNVGLSKTDEYTRSVSLLASTPNPAGDQAGIKSWDLERFAKNPVALWNHNRELMPIGKASDLEVTPEGLKLRITFASEKANPLAEQIFQATREEIVRACSVGYEWIDESVGHARLLEISMVPIPLDEDAGSPALNPDAERDGGEEDEEKVRVRVSTAAAEMARARARIMKKRALEKEACPTDEEMMKVQREDRVDAGGRLARAKPTSFGGAYIPARITRTGVLKYYLPDGTIRRELRLPEEVFKADSLATLDQIPVVDIAHHTTMLSPEDFKKAVVGNLKSYHRDGNFVASELVVQDADALGRIDRGERTEVSLGYNCRLDMTPGVWNGQPYDCIQRDIEYNHVALCPPNRGRAGPEVGLRLDRKPDARWGVASIHDDEGDKTMKTIRIDGVDFEFGSELHINKLESNHKAEIDKVRSEGATALKARTDAFEVEKKDLVKKTDEVQAKLDSAETTLKQERADAVAEKAKREEKEKQKADDEKKAARSRRRLERFFSRYFSGEDDMEDEEDTEGGDDKGKKKSRVDALDEKLDSMTDREIMVTSIKQVDPHFDEKDRSDDYVAARFDAEVSRIQKARGVDGVLHKAHEESRRLDASDAGDGAVEKARQKRDQTVASLWKGGASSAGKEGAR